MQLSSDANARVFHHHAHARHAGAARNGWVRNVQSERDEDLSTAGSELERLFTKGE